MGEVSIRDAGLLEEFPQSAGASDTDFVMANPSSPSLLRMLSRMPLDRHALGFAGYTSVAALAALACASLLGLTHPYWAALTVWVIAQPTRGLLLGRAMARLTGTVMGAGIGFLLLWLSAPHIWPLLSGLLLWIGLCAGGALLFRHFRSYAMLLAGFTACIVAMAGIGEPQFSYQLASARLLCTIIGVLASALVSGIFLPASAHGQLQSRLLSFAREVSALSAEALAGQPSLDNTVGALFPLMAEIEQLSDQLDAATPFWVTTGRNARRTLPAGLALLTASRAAMAFPHAPERCAAVAERLRPHASRTDGKMEPDIGFAHASCGIDEAYAAFSTAMRAATQKGYRYPRNWLESFEQMDWRTAGIASTRSMIALFLVASLWLATGWSYGSAMVMSAAVFVTLFSSHHNPVAATHSALKGSIAGACAALVYRLGILPHLATAPDLLLTLLPFFLVGGYAMARPATAKAAIDYNVSFLLISQPVLPTSANIAAALSQALAILAGVAAAVLVFRTILPTNPRIRMAFQLAAMEADLSALAASANPLQARKCLARMTTRGVRILSLGDAPHIPDLLIGAWIVRLLLDRKWGLAPEAGNMQLVMLLDRVRNSPSWWIGVPDQWQNILADLDPSAPS